MFPGEALFPGLARTRIYELAAVERSNIRKPDWSWFPVKFDDLEHNRRMRDSGIVNREVQNSSGAATRPIASSLITTRC
jgi:hypothetical protein